MTTPTQNDKNLSAAINAMSDYIHDVVPAMRERLENGFKRKANNKLYKADANDLRAILGPVHQGPDYPSAIHAYIYDNYEHGIHVEFKTTYPAENGSGCRYLSQSVYLWSTYEEVNAKLPDLSHIVRLSPQDLAEAREELARVENRIRHSEARRNELKRLLNK